MPSGQSVFSCAVFICLQWLSDDRQLWGASMFHASLIFSGLSSDWRIHMCDACSWIQSIDQISSEMRRTPTDRKLQWFVDACIDFSSIDLDSRVPLCCDYWRVSVNLVLACNRSTEELNRWMVKLCVLLTLVWFNLLPNKFDIWDQKRFLSAQSDQRHR